MRDVIFAGGLVALLAGCQDSAQETPRIHSPAQASAPSSSPSSVGGALPLSGTIALDPSLGKDAVRSEDILFIMARKSQDGGRAGQLIAVKKLTGLSFDALPAQFEIGPENTMMQGVPFEGPFVVYARLDRDGDPMTKTDEDLYASVPSAVSNGAQNLQMTLTKGSPKTAPTPAPASQPSSRPH